MESRDYAEELTLKEIIEIILKRKKIVVLSLVTFVALGIVLSFFILKPVYESKATYMISPIIITSGINPESEIIMSTDASSIDAVRNNEDKILGSLLSRIKYPQMDIKTMLNYISSDQYLAEILKSNSIDIAKYDYKKGINISQDEKTGTIKVAVKYGDANVAAKIREDIINKFPAFIEHKFDLQMSKVDMFITKEMEAESVYKATVEEKRTQLLELKNIDEISVMPSDKKNQYEDLNGDLLLANQTLDAYKLIKKEVKTIKSIDVKTLMDIQQISADKLPLHAISPRKTMNIGISVILGLFFGVILAFLFDYMNREFGIKI